MFRLYKLQLLLTVLIVSLLQRVVFCADSPSLEAVKKKLSSIATTSGVGPTEEELYAIVGRELSPKEFWDARRFASKLQKSAISREGLLEIAEKRSL